MQKIKYLLLSVALGFLIFARCECTQPTITSITPSSGPGGTIVEVVYSGGSIAGTIKFNGSSVETRSAGSLGLGTTIRFTIPFGTATGNQTVAVYSGGKTSPTVNFNVTGSGTSQIPEIHGFEIGKHDGSELTLFGEHFNTLSEVYVNNVKVTSYSGGSLPYRTVPLSMADNVIITTLATAMTSGTNYTVQVRNPDNKNSSNFTVKMPSRKIKVEFDAIAGIAFPDYYVWHHSTVNTFRRSYSECGWAIEFISGDTGIVDPESGTDWSEADMYSFFQAQSNPPSSGYYMHGSFIGEMSGGYLGIMWANTSSVPTLPSANNRQGFAVCSDEFAGYADRAQKYLRTNIHEAGHGFLLYHGDATGDTTVMTQTGSLNTGWHHFFSSGSKTHLNSHTIADVAPGGTAWGSRTCH